MKKFLVGFSLVGLVGLVGANAVQDYNITTNDIQNFYNFKQKIKRIY